MRRRERQMLKAWGIVGIKSREIVKQYHRYRIERWRYGCGMNDDYVVMITYPKGRSRIFLIADLDECLPGFPAIVKRDSGMVI